MYEFYACWGNVKIAADSRDEAIMIFFQIDTAKTGSHFHFVNCRKIG